MDPYREAAERGKAAAQPDTTAVFAAATRRAFPAMADHARRIAEALADTNAPGLAEIRHTIGRPPPPSLLETIFGRRPTPPRPPQAWELEVADHGSRPDVWVVARTGTWVRPGVSPEHLDDRSLRQISSMNDRDVLDEWQRWFKRAQVEGDEVLIRPGPLDGPRPVADVLAAAVQALVARSSR